MSQRVLADKPADLNFLLLALYIWDLEYSCAPGSTETTFTVFDDNVDITRITSKISKIKKVPATFRLLEQVMSICDNSESDALNSVGEAISESLETARAEAEAEALANAADDDDDNDDDDDDVTGDGETSETGNDEDDNSGSE